MPSRRAPATVPSSDTEQPPRAAKVTEVAAIPSDRLHGDAIYVGLICHTCRGSVALLRDAAEGASQIFFSESPARLLVMCPSCGVASEYSTTELVDVHVAGSGPAPTRQS